MIMQLLSECAEIGLSFENTFDLSYLWGRGDSSTDSLEFNSIFAAIFELKEVIMISFCYLLNLNIDDKSFLADDTELNTGAGISHYLSYVIAYFSF